MKKMDSTFAVLLASVALICTGNSVSQTPPTDNASATGSICVLPNSPTPPTRIRIDKREAIHWPQKTPTIIDGLDLQGNHLIVLASDGRQIMSARFRFSEYRDPRLCAYFDGYQGIQLGNTSDALWCKMKKRDCWPGESTDRQR
jgi:hypothetical protein